MTGGVKFVDPQRFASTGRRGGKANVARYMIEGESVTYADIAARLRTSESVARKRMSHAQTKDAPITWAGLSRNNFAAMPHSEEV